MKKLPSMQRGNLHLEISKSDDSCTCKLRPLCSNAANMPRRLEGYIRCKHVQNCDTTVITTNQMLMHILRLHVFIHYIYFLV